MDEISNLEEALVRAVKKDSPSRPWPVYRRYEPIEEGGVSYVVASVGLFEEIVDETGDRGGQGRRWRGREPEKTEADKIALKPYAPLQTPELIVDLAELADKPITPEAVVGWAETYGLLASSRLEDVLEQSGLVARERISGYGCRESVPSFEKAAKEIRTCLRAYEALRGREDLDLAELSARTDRLPTEALRPWERKPGHERAHLFGVLGRMVQMRLHEHCYPQFNIYTRGGHPTGRYALTHGFHGLIGAIWIQFAWLLESESRHVTFCKLPDCRRVVSFEPSEDLDADPDAEAHGRRKTRKDRVFCKGRGCKQKYDYRRKQGWPEHR
jgi:hypothetical protein